MRWTTNCHLHPVADFCCSSFLVKAAGCRAWAFHHWALCASKPRLPGQLYERWHVARLAPGLQRDRCPAQHAAGADIDGCQVTLLDLCHSCSLAANPAGCSTNQRKERERDFTTSMHFFTTSTQRMDSPGSIPGPIVTFMESANVCLNCLPGSHPVVARSCLMSSCLPAEQGTKGSRDLQSSSVHDISRCTAPHIGTGSPIFHGI